MIFVPVVAVIPSAKMGQLTVKNFSLHGNHYPENQHLTNREYSDLMKNTTCTIVIVTYNRLQFLKKAVESALSQTFPCEIVISDDASNDKTAEYVESLGNRVIYHRNNKPQGQSSVVNAGIKLATGQWIKLLDDDDWLEKNCIEIFLGAISKNSEVVICSCQATLVNQQKQIIGSTPFKGHSQLCYVKKEDIHYGMFTENLPVGTTSQIIFKKEAFQNTEGWNNEFNGYGNDIKAWVDIAQHGDLMFINQNLVYRTIWKGSYSRLSLRQCFENNIKLKEKMLFYIDKKYCNTTPSLDLISNFLKLYWGFNGIIKGQLIEGGQLLSESFLAVKSWQYFLIFLWRRKLKNQYFNFFIALD